MEFNSILDRLIASAVAFGATSSKIIEADKKADIAEYSSILKMMYQSALDEIVELNKQTKKEEN